MTVIAWDGKILAADKLALNNGLKRTTTKIRKIGDLLVGASGDTSATMEAFNWVEKGRIPSEYPKIQQSKEEFCCLIVILDNKILMYEMSPYPVLYEDKQFAIGSGRDLAIAAMHCGRSAIEAVEIASIYEASCGNGVDWITNNIIPHYT